MSAGNRLRRAAGLVCVAAVVAASAVVVYRAFVISYRGGSMYPRYSSHRADPMGLRVLHDALARVPELRVTRFQQSMSRLRTEPATLVVAGAIRSDDPRYIIEHIESFVNAGGRLVIAFDAEMVADDLENEAWRRPLEDDNEGEPEGEPEGEDAPAATEGEPESTPEGERSDEDSEAAGKKDKGDPFDFFVNIEGRWGFGFDITSSDDEGPMRAGRAEDVQAELLPETVAWVSPCVFTKLDESWITLYEFNGDPVIIERKDGEGSIVLATDSYFLSNEAVRDNRATGLLAWLVGPHRHVIFDESHLGIQRRPGIMSLMRRYRLHLLLAGLLAVAALYVWRCATSLAPRHSEAQQQARADEQAALEADAALVGLLRRTIPQRWVVAACCQAWRHDSLDAERHGEAAVREINEAALTSTSESVERYRALAALVNERKKP